jgi:hypothetical protein
MSQVGGIALISSRKASSDFNLMAAQLSADFGADEMSGEEHYGGGSNEKI